MLLGSLASSALLLSDAASRLAYDGPVAEFDVVVRVECADGRHELREAGDIANSEPNEVEGGRNWALIAIRFHR